MRYRHSQGLLVALLVIAGCCALSGSATALAAAPPAVASLRSRLTHPTPGDVITIAHRSCWKDTAENSLAGVRRCIEMGVDGVEFDVRHTSDGVAVVIHDETVDRTTEGHGAVSALTFAQIRRLHLRAGAGAPAAPLTAEHRPTLSEYLSAAKGRLLLVFDVKDGTQPESFAAAKAAGVSRQAIFFYECRNHDLLDKIKGFWDEALIFPIAFETDGPLSQSMDKCPSNPARMIHTKWAHDRFLESATAAIKARNERVWIATMFPDDVAGHNDKDALVDPASVWGHPLQAGANMIMTNEPQALLAFLGRKPAVQITAGRARLALRVRE
jgi:glycerophosphoryl diester phosphodiesterase